MIKRINQYEAPYEDDGKYGVYLFSEELSAYEKEEIQTREYYGDDTATRYDAEYEHREEDIFFTFFHDREQHEEESCEIVRIPEGTRRTECSPASGIVEAPSCEDVVLKEGFRDGDQCYCTTSPVEYA